MLEMGVARGLFVSSHSFRLWAAIVPNWVSMPVAWKLSMADMG
jgi:hypothetical protein